MTEATENLLVVLLEGGSRAELQQVIAERGGEPNVRVVAPAAVGKLEWLTSDEDAARAEADQRAARAASTIEDQATAEVEQGDTDLVLAVEDALRTFPAQEILIVGGEDDAVLELSLLPLGLPVTRVGASRPPEPGDGVARGTRRAAEGRSRPRRSRSWRGQPRVLLALVATVLLVVLAIWLF